MKYEEALSQLETIVRKMEAGEYDIDELSEQLKQAQKLIKLCKDKLTKTDTDIKKILDKESWKSLAVSLFCRTFAPDEPEKETRTHYRCWTERSL